FPVDWQRLLQPTALKKLMSLNRDIMIRTMILTLSFAWIMRLGAQQGDLLLAANVVLLQLLMISAYAIDGVAVTSESLVGQAYSQKNISLLKHIVTRTTITSLSIAATITALYLLIQPVFLALMTDIVAVAKIASQYYLFAAFSPLVGVIAYQFDGVMFGMTANALIRNSMIIVAVFFFPMSYLLALWLGNIGVWLSVYLLFILRGGILWWQYRHSQWPTLSHE
ncbi:MAG: MATE family efflux transporter, partial [Ostreibacterium sp.]